MHAIGYGYAAFIHFDTARSGKTRELRAQTRRGGEANKNKNRKQRNLCRFTWREFVAKMAESRDWRPWQHRIGGMLQSQRIVPSAHLCPSARGVSFQAMWQMFFDWGHICSKHIDHIDIEIQRRTIMNQIDWNRLSVASKQNRQCISPNWHYMAPLGTLYSLYAPSFSCSGAVPCWDLKGPLPREQILDLKLFEQAVWSSPIPIPDLADKPSPKNHPSLRRIWWSPHSEGPPTAKLVRYIFLFWKAETNTLW